MRKNQIKSIIIHTAECGVADDKLSAFHAEVIGRRLAQSGLAPAQQIAVIDAVIAGLKQAK